MSLARRRARDLRPGDLVALGGATEPTHRVEATRRLPYAEDPYRRHALSLRHLASGQAVEAWADGKILAARRKGA